ncbi:MAG: NAD-binding protein [Syntrophobacter sp.]
MSESFLECDPFSEYFPPSGIQILGAGRFGRIAAKRLSRRYPASSILVIDESAKRIEEVKQEFGVRGLARDSIEAITATSLPGNLWLVPAVPIHVGYEWVMRELNRSVRARGLPVPEEAELLVPNPMRSPTGTLYTSFADFICPDSCDEPAAVCTHTGKARTGNLFQVLGAMKIPDYKTMVLRSWQLAPGVGGYPAASLTELMAQILTRRGKYIVCTSCRCHGVIDALEWETA